MTIGSGSEAKTLPVQDVTFTGQPIWRSKKGQRITFYHRALDMAGACLGQLETKGQRITFYNRALDPDEIAKIYSDSMKEEEKVNYLFKVFVIDVKNQALLGEIPVICSDVPKATTIAFLRLDLAENTLGHLKFHVERICEVLEWDGD